MHENADLFQAAFLDVPFQILGHEPAGLDRRIGPDPGAGLLERIGLEDEHPAHVAAGIILKWTGLQELPFFRQTVDVGEVFLLQLVEFGFRELWWIRRAHEQDDDEGIEFRRRAGMGRR